MSRDKHIQKTSDNQAKNKKSAGHGNQWHLFIITKNPADEHAAGLLKTENSMKSYGFKSYMGSVPAKSASLPLHAVPAAASESLSSAGFAAFSSVAPK